MKPAIDFYFDFSSPYSYIASEWIGAVAARHGRTVNWRAILLGATFQVTGLRPPAEFPMKREYLFRDVARSAAFAGVAGGMYTLFVSFIHPESLGFQTTILVLTMIVVGGIGSIRGAVAGAIVFGVISELLRQTLSIQEIIYGAILMGFMMFRPRGLFAGRA